MKKYQLALLGLATLSASASQDAVKDTSAEGYLARGILMYECKNFTGCIDQLTEAKRMTPPASIYEDAEYYIAMSKFKRGDGDCLSALQQFAQKYPASLRRFDVWFNIGNSYFNKGKYGEASIAYGKVDDNAFTGEDYADLVYRRAFCQLRLAQFDKAQRGFEKLKGTTKYREASGFYTAYVSYANGNYAEASRGFKSISRQSSLWNEAQYYLCQIQFEDGDFDSALTTGNKLLTANLTTDMKAELNRVLGESEYHLGNNDRAVELLDNYVEQCTGDPERSSLYILGVAAYRNGNYDQAIGKLDAVVNRDDTLAQSAYLYIGQAYLHQDNVSAASMAFEKAYKMSYDRDVQETAFYNYAIAQSRGARTPFSNSVKIFEDFLNRFPKSKHASDVEDYIINSYMANHDYENALTTINSISSPSTKMLRAKQNVLYRLGVQSLEAKQTKSAISYLTQAEKLAGYDKSISAETLLWLGEAYYKNGEYAKAVTKYNSFVSKAGTKADNYALANYGLGYANFQQKSYSAATEAFKKAVNTGDLEASLAADTYNRIGDCNYYSRNYSAAEQYYEKAMNSGSTHADYALYQQGFMRGLQRQHNEKIAIMDEVVDKYPNSTYAPKALYEKAQAYIALNSNTNAESAFRSLMSRYPQSAEARQGQLQLALLYNSEGKRSQARSEYQSLIRKFPSSEEAKVAIEDLKVMYADDGNLSAFKQFMSSVDSSYQMGSNEMDQLTFQSAESEYINSGKTQRLKSYLSSYPNGAYAGQAAYYLAENAHSNNDNNTALEYLEKALKAAPDASFAESALAMQGQLLAAKGNTSEAQHSFKQLEAKATTDSNKQLALMGLMRIARDNNDLTTASKYAIQLLAGSLDKEDKAEVLFTVAKAHRQSGNKQKAIEELKQLTDDMQSRYGAMGTVELAEIYYDDGKLDSAQKLLDKLIDSGTPQQYWLARGFILLSDVYAKRGDKFQAREYLESLRDNYPGKEADITEMINNRLKALKK